VERTPLPASGDPMTQIRIRGSPIKGEKDLTVKLTLKFNPQKIGEAKTHKLLGGLIAAIADVLTPEQRAEFAHQFDLEQKRLTKAK
jgi:hypothetical protein